MTRDKQLVNVPLARVIEKRRLDQALNTKEFAVLAGISYSTARAWFRLPGFPAFCGVVFWPEFVKWRADHAASQDRRKQGVEAGIAAPTSHTRLGPDLPERAAKILAAAG